MSDPAPTLYYVHDPMCSWCWGYRPVLLQVRAALQNQLRIVSVLGGLAPDTDEPMPVEMQQQIESYWYQIEKELGAEFNHNFWKVCQPRRSTYPACRAVIAARQQRADEAMILAIQHAYYLRAMNPSEEDTLLQLADEMGLDFDRFARDLQSDETEQQLLQELSLRRQLGVNRFPSWVLQHGDRLAHIQIDYQSAHATLAQISVQLQS